MKTLIAAAALTLLAGAAMAEGNGEPFPNTATNGRVISLTNYQRPNGGTYQNPYPFVAPGVPMVQGQVLPTNGSAGAVQTVNSLPVGAEDGPAALATLNGHVTRATQLAQPGTIQAAPRG